MWKLYIKWYCNYMLYITGQHHDLSPKGEQLTQHDLQDTDWLSQLILVASQLV